jgi:hypothetical protein
VKAMMVMLGLVLTSVVPTAAVPVGDSMILQESLTIEVIHSGPACSSGSVLVAGACQPEGTVPPVVLPGEGPALVALTAEPGGPAARARARARNGALARDGARVGGWRPRGSPVDPGNLAGPMTELLA